MCIDRKGTLGCCFGLGSTFVSWFNLKQKLVALSFVETKYMEASHDNCEAIWIHKLLVGIFGHELRPTMTHCDNHGCFKLFKNLVFHDRSKHIEIIYHFIYDWVQRGAVQLEYISTDENIVDILMESLPRGKHVYFRDKMGVVKNTFLGKREC
jgi:hypothetical protein